MADPPFKRGAMVQLRKYRTMTSKDGSEDEGGTSLSLSEKHMFQRSFFNVFCVFCVASYNEEHLGCSPDIHLMHSVDGGRPLDSSGSSEEWCDSKIFMMSIQQPMAPLVLVLWLDSGAAHHAVGDARILCNLRDPPARTAVRAADGVRLLVHKIGDIHTPYIKIQDVYLVPGLQDNLISVRQLAKHQIVTTFYENYAELLRDGKQVGGAIVDNVTSLYRLYYLMPMEDPEAGTSRYILEEAMDVATATGATSREEAMNVATARGATSRNSLPQLYLSLSTSTSTESEQQFQCKTCGRCFTTFQALGGHRSSHMRGGRQRVHADDPDQLLGAHSGKGAAQTVHCFPTFQALGGHRTSHIRRQWVHADDLDLLLGARSVKGADSSETSLADGERWHSSGEQRTVAPSVEVEKRIVHFTTSYPACPMCVLYK